MREIKFRAWDKLNNHMLEVDDIHFGLGGEVKGIKSVVTEIETVVLSAKQMELMQFTGLLDKNGKEIYEADIIREEPAVFSVGWEDGTYIVRFPDGMRCVAIDQHFTRKFVVIGNIYENPQLVKQS